MATAVQAATATSPTSAEAAAEQQQQMYLQQQYAAQGITHGYPGMMDDGPVDPMQAQVAAFNNQAAMYGPYGAPYALNFPHQQPHAYYAGMPQLNMATGLMGSQEPFSLPGPCYYDPYGMLNPAACVTPIQAPPKEAGAPQPSTHIKRKQNKKWFGCC